MPDDKKPKGKTVSQKVREISFGFSKKPSKAQDDALATARESASKLYRSKQQGASYLRDEASAPKQGPALSSQSAEHMQDKSSASQKVGRDTPLSATPEARQSMNWQLERALIKPKN